MTRCPHCGKDSFCTYAGAYKRITFLAHKRTDRQDAKRDHGPMRAYRCPHGNGFHVGHDARDLQRAIRTTSRWHVPARVFA